MFDHSRYHQHKNPIINSVDYNSISSSAVSEVKVVTMAYPFEKRNTKDILILGSCDGIICLGISSYGNGIDQKNRICIWNPATGEFMNIKLPLSELRGKSSYFFRYGFGYDINIDDYNYPESYVESLVSFKSRTYVKQKPTNHNKKKPKRQSSYVLSSLANIWLILVLRCQSVPMFDLVFSYFSGPDVAEALAAAIQIAVE
ncbi:hypothetical protein C5167_004634 [Papaver somniferum]|uniref:F-box associated domain-containing protein n=1 Tax=Papaver somniferum TaxID=3469 RepID=A0A4Y7JBE4_PAPSO|nr:hypothetical protein C5167_004634 [Papaver somniferum]